MVELLDTDKLWRYMDFDKFVNMLAFKDVFLNSASGYPDDPFENYCDIVNTVMTEEELAEKYDYYAQKENCHKENLTNEQKKAWLAALFCKIQDATVISCWHRNNNQSAAMWNLYATNPKTAIAIRTDFKTLKECFPTNIFQIKLVQYVDYKDFIPNAYEAIWYKRLVYQHENELRVVKVESNYGERKHNPEGSVARTGGITHLYPIDLNALVQCIYLSPYANLVFAETVAALMQKYGLEVPLLFQDRVYPEINHCWKTPRELMGSYCKAKDS